MGLLKKSKVKGMNKLNWDGCFHCVVDVTDYDYVADIHTHGLADEIGTELQYILYGGEERNDEIFVMFAQVGFLLKNGKLDADSSEPFELMDWDDCKFKFYKSKDCDGEDILRIIECDMEGKFPEDEGCDEIFSKQYIELY